MRELITEGLAQRAEAKIKVRQPLASVTSTEGLLRSSNQIIADELNVKEVKRGTGIVELDTEVTPELKAEGIARDLIRFVQNARKNAGFNVEDRIQLKIESENPQITEAVGKFKDMIFAETLATGELEGDPEHTEVVKLDGIEITLKLSRNR